MSTSAKTDGLSAKISAAWTNSVSATLKVGRLCADADKAVSRHEKAAFIETLPFGRSTFSKLVVIGRDKRLYEKALRKSLPPSFSILYEISHLKTAVLNSAIKFGKIHPEVTRAQVCRLLEEHHPHNSPVDAVGEFFKEIRMPADFPLDGQLELNTLLHNWELKWGDKGAELLGPSQTPSAQSIIGKYEKALSVRETRILEMMRQLINKRVKQLMRKKGVKRLPQDHGPTRDWAFGWDEYYLQKNDQELSTSMKRVITEVLGGDEVTLQNIREEAEVLVSDSQERKWQQKLQEIPFMESPMPFDANEIRIPVMDKATLNARYRKLKV